MNRIKIADFITGKKVWDYYQLYNKTQWYSDSEMNELQIRKLKKLLKHCYDNVPYYRTVIDEKKIDIENFDSLSVLSEFPALTKEIIQKNYQAFIPLNNNQIKGVKISQTGGTTGNILYKRNDSQTRSSIWGSFKRYEEWMNMNKDDRTLILMGGHVKEKNFRQKTIEKAGSLLENSVSVDIYNTSDETTEKVINLLLSNKFSMIRSYPQFLFEIAKKLEKRGLSFDIKAISSTAEPVMPEQRALFRKVFNAEVFDQYGCGEIGGMAYECNRHEGLHIAEERVIIETNETNELLITDLDNFTMPFIRYWNADQAILSNEKCSCGRQSRLIRQILGRTCDYITGINGQYLHWAYFWHLVFESNIAENRNLRKFQIIQNSASGLLIKLVSNALSDEEEEFLRSDIKKRLGEEMSIVFSYEPDIENSANGKYRPVINKLL
jgi:phenylacetate-CoA ligase